MWNWNNGGMGGNDPMSMVSNLDTIIKTGSDLVQLIQGVKGLLGKPGASPQAFQPQQQQQQQQGQAGWQAPAMQTFRPQMQDPYHGGAQWLPQIQQMAAQNGNAWVPQQTQGIGDVDLTGVWCPPGNPMDQTYIRQFGPYLNLVAGIMGMPTVVAEGLYDPVHRSVYIVGRYFNGAPVEVRSQLLPNWMLQGVMTVPGPMGFPMQMPHLAVKVA